MIRRTSYGCHTLIRVLGVNTAVFREQGRAAAVGCPGAQGRLVFCFALASATLSLFMISFVPRASSKLPANEILSILETIDGAEVAVGSFEPL